MIRSLIEWSRVHHGWVVAFYLTLAARIWFGILGAYALLVPNNSVIEPLNLYWGLPRPPSNGVGLLLTPWERWDAIWYLRITTFGYSADDPSPSFFPLYSIFAHSLGDLLYGNYLLASIVVSTIATFLAFGFLYHLVIGWTDPGTATRALFYWAIFPTSFYLFGGYAEPLLAACALASIYFAEHKSWWLAGAAAAGAAVTRPVGIMILVPLTILVWSRGANVRERAAALLISWSGVVIAFAAWMFFLYKMFKDPMLWARSQDYWVRVFVFPWESIGLTVRYILDGGSHVENNLLDLTLTIVALGAILLCLRRLPFAYTAYALFMLIVPLTSYSMRDEFWTSMPMAAAGRRALVVFPVFIALGSLIKQSWLQAIWIPLSLAVQAVLFISFAQWVWVD